MKKQVLFKPDQKEIEEEIIEKLKSEPIITFEELKLKEREELILIYNTQQNFNGVTVSHHTKMELLELERELLLPRIKKIIDKLYRRTTADASELAELLACYNAYYKRSDSFSCGSCVARAYEALKKLVR